MAMVILPERHSCMGYGKLKGRDFLHGTRRLELGQQALKREPILS